MRIDGSSKSSKFALVWPDTLLHSRRLSCVVGDSRVRSITVVHSRALEEFECAHLNTVGRSSVSRSPLSAFSDALLWISLLVQIISNSHQLPLLFGLNLRGPHRGVFYILGQNCTVIKTKYFCHSRHAPSI